MILPTRRKFQTLMEILKSQLATHFTMYTDYKAGFWEFLLDRFVCGATRQKFSQVSSLLNSPCKLTVELSFQNPHNSFFSRVSMSRDSWNSWEEHILMTKKKRQLTFENSYNSAEFRRGETHANYKRKNVLRIFFFTWRKKEGLHKLNSELTSENFVVSQVLWIFFTS